VWVVGRVRVVVVDIVLNVVIVVHDNHGMFGRFLTVTIAMTFAMFVVTVPFAVPVIVRACGCSGKQKESWNGAYQQQDQKQSLFHFVPLTNAETVVFLEDPKKCFLLNEMPILVGDAGVFELSPCLDNFRDVFLPFRE
jgi:hypothetical protein